MALIQMIGLRTIKSKMLINDLSRTVFSIDVNQKVFSCLFIIDIIPYRLYLTTLGENPHIIEFEVKNNFMLDTKLDYDDYYALVNYLKYIYDSKNKFQPIKF